MLGATGADDPSSGTRAHPPEKTVLFFPFTLVRLERSFHKILILSKNKDADYSQGFLTLSMKLL